MNDGDQYKNNIITLFGFGDLKCGWDGYHALEICNAHISRAIVICDNLQLQPCVFPCPEGTIQFEYSAGKNYLEFEIGKMITVFCMYGDNIIAEEETDDDGVLEWVINVFGI